MDSSPRSNMDFPMPKWTSINDPATLPKCFELDNSNELDSLSTAEEDNDESFQGLTDEEIFTGGLHRLTGKNLLQVAGTHTNNEIVARINENHAKPVLSNKTLSNKIDHALKHGSKRQGRPREELANELRDVRKKNGVLKRRYADIGAKGGATKRAKKIRKLELGVEGIKEEEDKATGDPLSAAGKLSFEKSVQEEEKSDLRLEFEAIVREGEKLLFNDRLLRVSGVLTNNEILSIANATGKGRALNSVLVRQRLWKAMKFVAERDGKTREAVKAELEATRRINGVLERQQKYINEARTASQARLKKTSVQVQHAADIDEDDDLEDDLLADLDEMRKRVAEGRLNAYHSDSEVSLEPIRGVESEEFPNQRPLPPSIGAINRFGAIPVVIDGRFRAYTEADMRTLSTAGESTSDA